MSKISKIEEMYFYIIGRMWGLQIVGLFDIEHFNNEMKDIQKIFLSKKAVNRK